MAPPIRPHPPRPFLSQSLYVLGKTLKAAMQMSREFSLPLQIHLSETKAEVDEVFSRTGERPAFYLDRLALLSGDLIAVHGVHLQDEEIDLICRRGVGIVHCPESNMKLASGVAGTSRMVATGIDLGAWHRRSGIQQQPRPLPEMDTAAKLGKVSTLNPVSMGAARC
jgi:5-methylthioadenosine/S-adenosylhomocysteine deaminase